MTSREESLGSPRKEVTLVTESWIHVAQPGCALLRFYSIEVLGSPREVPRKSQEVIKWFPRKALGKVAKVTKVMKCIIEHKIDHPAS